MTENTSDERRKNIRYTYAARIYCSKAICGGTAKPFEPPQEMDVENIAVEGICLSTSELFEENTMLKFDIALEDVLYPGVTGTIVWRKQNGDLYYYGVHLRNTTGKLGVHIADLGRKVSRKV